MIRVVVQEAVYSGPSSFAQFDDEITTFVDKSLAIEAFLRDRGGHHLVLRPRRCGKSSQFAGTAITDHGELVSKHFRQYPILYIDFKVNWLVSVSKGVILIGSRMFMEPHTKTC